LDSIDVNSYIKNLNIKFEKHPDRIAYLYGTIYSDFERDTVIMNADAFEDVYVNKIYVQYEIFDDSTISYYYKRSITCFVNYNDIMGYMWLPESYFDEYVQLIKDNYRLHNEPIYQYQEAQKEIEDELWRQKQKEKKEQLLKERTTKYIKKYGKKYGTLVVNKEIQLGMTKEMVDDSWGKPKDINRTVGSWGVYEQWVYSNTYLYFENGKLTSWQD
jgi:hypothetical protein